MLGVNLERDVIYYWVVAAIGMAVCVCAVALSSLANRQVLVAIRENEQRARFIGYPTNRVQELIGFPVLSATVVADRRRALGLQSTVSLRLSRWRAAFSGELIAMVVIGGMRTFSAGAGRAVLYCSGNSFSIWTSHWLFISACCSSPSSCFRQPASSAWPSACWRRGATCLRGGRHGCSPDGHGALSLPRTLLTGTGASAESPVLVAARGPQEASAAPMRCGRLRSRDAGPHATCLDRSRTGARQSNCVQPAVGALSRRSVEQSRLPVRIDRGPETGRHHRGRRRPLVPDHQSVRRPER